MAEQAGFRVEQVLNFNRPGVPAWWLNGRVLHRKTFGLGQIRMLNILTPLFRLVDSWLPLPPLSIIAILRKDNGEGRANLTAPQCVVIDVAKASMSVPQKPGFKPDEETKLACVGSRNTKFF